MSSYLMNPDSTSVVQTDVTVYTNDYENDLPVTACSKGTVSGCGVVIVSYVINVTL